MRTEIWRNAELVEVIPDPRPLEEQRAERLAMLADRRWQATQTCVIGGVTTPADSAGGAITGAILSMQLPGGPASIRWKLNDVTFVDFDLAGLIAHGQAVRAHIQACFDHESAQATALMAAADADALDAVDIDAGWPT